MRPAGRRGRTVAAYTAIARRALRTGRSASSCSGARGRLRPRPSSRWYLAPFLPGMALFFADAGVPSELVFTRSCKQLGRCSYHRRKIG